MWQTNLRGALFQRDAGELLQKKAVVRGVGGAGAGDSGRRRLPADAAKGIDHQAAVVGQDPLAQMPGLMGGLERGVFGKGPPSSTTWIASG